MGAAAARSDLVVLTSDNPRTESPEAILDDVVPGLVGQGLAALSWAEAKAGQRGFLREADRGEAIARAIACAGPGDVVLIAGKGHEDYQIVGKTKRPFDDRVQARAALEGGRA